VLAAETCGQTAPTPAMSIGHGKGSSDNRAKRRRLEIWNRMAVALFVTWATLCTAAGAEPDPCANASCALDPEYDRIREYERGGLAPPSAPATSVFPNCVASSCSEGDSEAERIRGYERGTDVFDHPWIARSVSAPTTPTVVASRVPETRRPQTSASKRVANDSNDDGWSNSTAVVVFLMAAALWLLIRRRR
jgi:hypothetical protein